MLFIEYDVNEAGEIELVALIDAVEENGEDPDGEAWHEWRRSHDDDGFGCAKVAHIDRERLDATDDPDELHRIVGEIVLADRRAKEDTQ